MARPRGGRQYSTPLLLDRLDEQGIARALEPIRLIKGDGSSGGHDELWLQRLIFRFPQVLPVHEIEPGFGALLPVCMELPTSAGHVDNLYVTERGDLAIAECKLWRNPDARREVVAQIIDYAHSMASWTYEDLESAIRKAMVPDGQPPVTLFSLVGDSGEISEPDFIDAVSRNLRLGRMLLLVVGDGIREGVESLSEYLQIHAGFHFTLSVVELPAFTLPDGRYIVQPRTLARTVNIERGIVRIVDSQARIEQPTMASLDEAKARRLTISEDRLREQLAANAPETLQALDRFMERATELGVYIEPAEKSLQLKWLGPEDIGFALGGITDQGALLTYNIGWKPSRIGRVDLAHRYLYGLAELIGGKVRKTKSPRMWEVRDAGGFHIPNAISALSRQHEWLNLIEGYTENLAQALEARNG